MRALLATATAVAASLATVVVGGVAHADPTHAAPATANQSPVGTWSADVILDGDPTTKDHAVISFTAAGKVCLATSISAGDGAWVPTGGNGFHWVDDEVFQQIPGAPGFVLIDQQGALAGSTFTSSGVSQVFDRQGNWIKSVTADLTATRTSPTPDPACQ